MAENEDRGIKIDLDIGAKAALEAKISTEIPSQSSGRLLDTLTDMIRPFAERRGLKADQIRLQREEILIEIARRARHRLAIENLSPSPLPNKFLVPFLEKASLEGGEDILIDLWADLLVISSSNPNEAHPRFIQILSEITAPEAKLLNAISRNTNNTDPKWIRMKFDDNHLDYLPENIRSEHLENWFEKFARGMEADLFEDTKFRTELDDFFTSPGIALEYAFVTDWRTSIGDELKRNKISELLFRNQESVEILISLGILIRREMSFSATPWELELHYLQTSRFGINFLHRCDYDLR